MDPYAIFRRIWYKELHRLGIVIGYGFLDPHYRISLATFIAHAITSFAVFCGIYSIFAFDLDISLQAMAICLINLQGELKMIIALIYRKEIFVSMKTVEEIFKQNLSTIENRDVFNHFTRWLSILSKCMYVQYFCSSMTFFFAPFLYYPFLKEWIYMLPIFIPGVHKDSTKGYIITTCFHSYFCITAFFVYSCIDISFAVLVGHVILMTRLIRNKIQALNRMVTEKRRGNSDLAMWRHFRNIIQMQKELFEYVNGVATIFFYQCLSQIFLTAMFLGVGIFTTFVIDWMCAYVLIAGAITQIFLVCAIGTIVEIAYDELNEELMTSNWYLMTEKCRHDFVLLLQAAQNAPLLTVGGIRPLNMDTFVGIMRVIYSFAIFMKKVFQ